MNDDTKFEIDLTEVLPTKVTRTLKSDQVLCPTCKGAGLILRTDAKGDYITTCNTCHGRTYLEKCPHCSEVEQGFMHHRCEGTERERALKIERGEQEKWDKAEKISYAEACKRYEQVVIGFDTYVLVDGVLDQIADEWFETDRTIPRVWGTQSTSLVIDVDDILEGQIGELHEDAGISKEDYVDLKTFLEAWCNRPSVYSSTLTYYPDESIAIVITEDELFASYPDLKSEDEP